MIDMGQADSSLRRKPSGEEHVMVWTRALQKAAIELGYDHYMRVPDSHLEAVKFRARSIQLGK